MTPNRLSAMQTEADSTFVSRDSLFLYLPARVISNSINNRNNFIMIDKGMQDGVEKEMGVVSLHGLAGIVIGVSDHYAYVMSMLHRNSRISAKIKKDNQLVNVVWEGIDYTNGTVIDIPSHIVLNPGDTIVTSGHSLIFPEGIDIGTVVEQEKSADKAFGNAKLAFSIDFNSLLYVFVIRNLNKTEQLELIDQSANE